MKQSNLNPRQLRRVRRIVGRAQEDRILDPYPPRQKLDEGTVCPHCGAVYQEGRWQWVARAEDVAEELCSACRRINDKFPAGILRNPIVITQAATIINDIGAT